MRRNRRAALAPSAPRDLVQSGAQLRFVSTELREVVLGALPLAQHEVLHARSRVEPCAIDVERVPSKLEARELLGVAPDARLAVIVARLVAGKRVDVALAACDRLPALDVVVVGEGPERTVRIPT